MPLLHLTDTSCIIWLGSVSLRHCSHWSISDVESKFGGDELLEFLEVLYLQVTVASH